MNHTTFNATSSSCDNYLYSIKTTNISSDLRDILIIRIIVNALTCPLIIVLNILMMVAVKTKQHASHQVQHSTRLFSRNWPCSWTSSSTSTNCKRHSISQRRHHDLYYNLPAIKHCNINMHTRFFTSFGFDECWALCCDKTPVHIREARHWSSNHYGLCSGVDCNHCPFQTSPSAKPILVVSETLLIILLIHFNVSVYKEVCRNKNQIAANQVSLEAEKLIKDKKAFHTTIIVLLVVLLCYIPTIICAAILISLKERIPSNIKLTSLLYCQC